MRVLASICVGLHLSCISSIHGFRWKKRILGWRGGNSGLPPPEYDAYQQQPDLPPPDLPYAGEDPYAMPQQTSSFGPPPPPPLPFPDDPSQQQAYNDFPFDDTPEPLAVPASLTKQQQQEQWDTSGATESPSMDLSAFDKEFILRGLARLYRKKILPLELSSRYGHFHSPPLSPSDFDAPPMILMLGQYSVGKTSFIKYLLGRDFPGIRGT